MHIVGVILSLIEGELVLRLPKMWFEAGPLSTRDEPLDLISLILL